MSAAPWFMPQMLGAFWSGNVAHSDRDRLLKLAKGRYSWVLPFASRVALDAGSSRADYAPAGSGVGGGRAGASGSGGARGAPAAERFPCAGTPRVSGTSEPRRRGYRPHFVRVCDRSRVILQLDFFRGKRGNR
jgi:hypothetical protein